ncbi:hypothetical protein V5799_024976, partial [Amblyomma americanum]
MPNEERAKGWQKRFKQAASSPEEAHVSQQQQTVAVNDSTPTYAADLANSMDDLQLVCMNSPAAEAPLRTHADVVTLTLFFTWLIPESLSPPCPSAQMLPPPLPDNGPFNISFIPAHPIESLAFDRSTPSTTASSPTRNLSCGLSVRGLDSVGTGTLQEAWLLTSALLRC